MRKGCLGSFKRGSFVGSNASPNGRISPFSFQSVIQSMIRLAKKRSLCHVQRTPLKGCDWHYSHKDHQSVWGHSLVWVMVHTFTQAFLFASRLYDKKTGKSKIDLVIEMLSSIKGKLTQSMYVLMDSFLVRSLPSRQGGAGALLRVSL